ncbi:hypothetical protein Pcinc_010878 [Petrolisthes cinctipes]|uniref:C3H1-type domain-containing protein n=1 Tax=Petrolisthes cinctipes TaxID=88211 RepID=A0AAE1KU28_PETCI|nr:hypothetical protein Pcinc_010878 [Petrolisthes cinctipes]
MPPLGSTPEDIDFSALCHSDTSNSDRPNQPSTSAQSNSNSSRGKNTPPSHSTGTADTVCKFYRKGLCRYGRSGDKCKYRHPNVCTKLMNHGPTSERGCKLGNQCRFLHPLLCESSVASLKCLDTDCKKKTHQRYQKAKT